MKILILIVTLLSLSACLKNSGGGNPRVPAQPIQDDAPLEALRYSSEADLHTLGTQNPNTNWLKADEVQEEGQDLTFSFKFAVGLEKKLQILRAKKNTSCSGGISPEFKFILVQESPTRVVLEENLETGIKYNLNPNESYSLEVVANAVGCTQVDLGVSLWVGYEGVNPIESIECTYDGSNNSFVGNFILDYLTLFNSLREPFLSEEKFCGVDFSATKTSMRLEGEETIFEFSYEVDEENTYEATYTQNDLSNKGRIECRKNGELEKEFIAHNCKRKIVDSKVFSLP